MQIHSGRGQLENPLCTPATFPCTDVRISTFRWESDSRLFRITVCPTYQLFLLQWSLTLIVTSSFNVPRMPAFVTTYHKGSVCEYECECKYEYEYN